MAGKNPRRIGQYEILGELGEGAMGKVYKAVQPSLNRVVAIKVLPAEFLDDESRVERFNREAQAVALINHANVVQIIDKDREDDHLYFVMEYVAGMSLDVLMNKRRLSLREALVVIKGVSRGLAAAHAKSVVHRDLNPRNILISEDLTTVKVADFGISRVEAISRTQGTLSTNEVSLGTLHYIAPEQATDMVGADHRADIYSLGVLLYEMLTGRVPVGRFNLPSQLNEEVPSGIDPIVLKCLSADPDERYPSADALLTDIRKLEDRLRLGLVQDLHGISRSTGRILRRSTSTLRLGRRKWIPIAGAALVIALVGALLVGRELDREPSASDVAASNGSPTDRSPRPSVETSVDEPVGSAGASPAGSPGEGAAAGPATGIVSVAGVAGRRQVEIRRTEPFSESALTADLDTLDLNGFEPPVPTGDDGDDAAESVTAMDGKAAPVASDLPSTSAPPAPARVAAAPRFTRDLEVAREKYLAKLYEPALDDLEQLIAENGKHPDAADAYLLRGQVEQSDGRLEEALATYVETVTRFPRAAAAPEAKYRQARLTIELGGKERMQQGLNIAHELVEQYPRSPWAPEALVLAADTEDKLRLEVRDATLGTSVPASLVSYRTLAEQYADSAGAERALWSLGEAYEDLKRFGLAAEAFEKLATAFPGTRYDAWWRSARLYDRKLDNKAKAVAAYQRVPESSPDYGDAQKRISKLGG